MSEYIPKPDPEGINTSTEKSPILDSIILVGGFVFIIFVSYWVLGFAVEKLLVRVPIEKEIQFFQKFYFVDGKTRETNSALIPIQEKLNVNLQFPINIEVRCSSEMNAFAFPGGRIVLTSELFNKLQTENALIFVIGHELGHFANRDHLKGLGRQIVLSTITAIAGIGGSTDYISSLGGMSIRKFQQSQELKADEFGLNLIEKVYGHYFGADEFFQVVSAKESNIEKVFASFVSTHPPSDERIEIINLRKKNSKKSQSESKTILLSEEFKNSVKCSGEI